MCGLEQFQYVSNRAVLLGRLVYQESLKRRRTVGIDLLFFCSAKDVPTFSSNGRLPST